MTWIGNEDWMGIIYGNDPPTKLIGFDLDDTLSIKKGDQMEEAMKYLKKNVTKYAILVISNQSGAYGKTFPMEEWKEKVVSLIEDIIGVNKSYYVGIYASKNWNCYRKPAPFLVYKALKHYEKITGVARNLEWFCGDAAGRKQISTLRKKYHPTSKVGDHSDVDRKLALNLEIPFYTPEEVFLNENPSPYSLAGYDPKPYTKVPVSPPIQNKTLYLIMGYPATGKTWYHKKYLSQFPLVSQDIYKTEAKCILKVKELIKKGSVVVEGLLSTNAKREKYTSLAQKTITIEMEADVELAMHLNWVRHIVNCLNNKHHQLVHPIVYKTHRKYLEPDPNAIKTPLGIKEWIQDKRWVAAYRLRYESVK
jgi:bifunctional polynucleotide phosphatase/kinase